MKVALLADIHGNTWALDAALADLEREQPDQMVCLGDVSGHSPYPHDAIERLRRLQCPGVVGNGDAELLDMLDPTREAQLFAILQQRGYPAAEIERRQARNRWALDQLTSDDIEYLRSLYQTLEVQLGDGETLFCFHASPSSYLKGIRATTSDADLRDMLSGYQASIFACGHTHVPFLRSYDEQMIVNPGSIAGFVKPDTDYSSTHYVLVTWDKGRITVDFRRVSYDARPLIAAAYASGMPAPEVWLYQPDHR